MFSRKQTGHPFDGLFLLNFIDEVFNLIPCGGFCWRNPLLVVVFGFGTMICSSPEAESGRSEKSFCAERSGTGGAGRYNGRAKGGDARYSFDRHFAEPVTYRGK